MNLYCLTATTNKKEKDLDWLEEAIITKELWYRADIFEDDKHLLDNVKSRKFYIRYGR